MNRTRGWYISVLGLMMALLASLASPRGTHAAATRPFALPFRDPSGPNTWLLEQHYGNTLEAYVYGKYWYADGQGLHFGVDFEVRCGTPLLAIADGDVLWVDASHYGAGPHNLVLAHRDLGYVSVYGHLLERPNLSVGQKVRRGQVIAHSGDPDLTCTSRPHLHLEIRSADSNIAYNPEMLMDADWDRLALLADPFEITFAKDLNAPDRWQMIADQPPTRFMDTTANAYRRIWPPILQIPQTLAAFDAPPLDILPYPPSLLSRLADSGCCVGFWWAANSSDSQSIRYVTLDSERRPRADNGDPLQILSPDGEVAYRGLETPPRFYRLNGESAPWSVNTRGEWPAFSPQGRQVLWQVHYGDEFPNAPAPLTEIWVAAVDGSNARLIRVQAGGAVYWLDEDRLLLVAPGQPRLNQRTLAIYTLRTGEITPLGTFYNLRNLGIAPGGERLLFFTPFQPDPARSGIYLLETKPGAQPQKMPFLGSWRWRDSRNVVVVPYNTPGDTMALGLYDVQSGEMRALASPPFKIANAEWSVAPDGQSIAFIEARDQAIWVLRLSLIPAPTPDVIF